MARLLRIVDVGGKSFCAWIEDDGNFHGDAVTFTIDSEPYVRRPLNHWRQEERDEEAIKYFKEWLAKYGVSINPPGEANIADELVKLSDLRSKGMLSEDEFAEAKRKLLKD